MSLEGLCCSLLKWVRMGGETVGEKIRSSVPNVFGLLCQ